MAPRPEPVTNDWQVTRAMLGDPPEEGYAWLSAEIAASLEITVFQITARLKGMEGRKLVYREQSYWALTPLGFQLGSSPEPPKKIKPPLSERVYSTPTGGIYSPGGGAASLPSDEGVPKVSDTRGWKMRYLYGPKERIPVRQGSKIIGYEFLARTQIEVHIDPDGNEWVRCDPIEPAELIRLPVADGLSCSRFRRRTGSTAAERRLLREEGRLEEALERDEARLARRRKG